MSQSEQRQLQHLAAGSSAQVWEQQGHPPRLSVEALIKAIVSFYYALSGDQFAVAVGDSSEALYLRFSALAAELGDLPVSVVEQVVEAYFQMVEAEQGQGQKHTPDLTPPSGSVTR
jgi:hypothetical protein